MATATQLLESGPSSPQDAEWARKALERGELVRLLAEMEAGRIDQRVVNDLLSRRDKERWLHKVFFTFFR